MPEGIAAPKGPVRRPVLFAPARRGMREDAGYTRPRRAALALGSPERGAVAARRAVTEGLAQRGWGVPTLSVDQCRAGAEVGWRVEPAVSVIRRTAHRGRCALRREGNVSALQLRHPSSNGRGVGDAAPYGVCDRVGFSGAVRYSLSHPLCYMPQPWFICRP